MVLTKNMSAVAPEVMTRQEVLYVYQMLTLHTYGTNVISLSIAEVRGSLKAGSVYVTLVWRGMQSPVSLGTLATVKHIT